jgi:general secretion pathway protein E
VESPPKVPKRALQIEEVLTLLVADGLVTSADADSLARAKVRRTEHPLEIIAEKNWHTATGPRMPLTLDWLVEWLAGKLGVPYLHIDPLKIDLTAVTQTMTNAYAERYRILPVEVNRTTLTVATSDPFVRDWADELEKILKLDVRLVFANPKDIRRYLGEFYNLARSMKKAQEVWKGEGSIARDFEQLVALGQQGKLDANDSHVVHIVDWLWQYAFDQRASDIHVEPRAQCRARALPHRRRAARGLQHPDAGAGGDDVADQAPGPDGDRREAAPAGRPDQDGDSRRGGGRAADLDDADGVRREGRDAHLHARGAGSGFRRAGFTVEDRDRWAKMIKEPNGIILVTGPTGSGQDDDAVLVAQAARHAGGQRLHGRGPDRDDRAAVQPDAGAAGDRRRLRPRRADADAPGSGHHHGRRIRDRDTADMAVQAALTGHLVLASLHTNDAPTAVTRMLDLGMPRTSSARRCSA